MASTTKISDILILGLISGIVAILTSVMGVSGTIIGSVVSSILAELLKTYFKDPVTDKISEYEKSNSTDYHSYGDNSYQKDYSIHNNYQNKNQISQKQESSHITTRILFLFPLVVILIIELINFLGAINIIPNNILMNLESLTNWTLFRTIGYALVIMGIYPLVSKKLGTQHGIILIIVGIIELIIGYADTSTQASLLYSAFASLKGYINIVVIISILYTILTVPEEIKEDKKQRIYTSEKHFENRGDGQSINSKKEYNNFDNTYYEENSREYQNLRSKQSQKRQSNYRNSQKYENNINEDDDYYYY